MSSARKLAPYAKEDRDTVAKQSVTAFQTKTQQEESVLNDNTSQPADILVAPVGFARSDERQTMSGRPVFDGPEVELAECDASIWSDWTEASGVRVTLNTERPLALHELAEVHGAIGSILAKVQRSMAPKLPQKLKPLHPEATGKYINQLIKYFGLTTTEIGVFHMTLAECPDWHPEVTCTFIVEARDRGNEGLMLLTSLALSDVPGAYPGGSMLDRDHKLARLGSIWDYVGLLKEYIAEESKDHWRDGNCAKEMKAADPKLSEGEKCTKREHAESALGFLRMAAADTHHRKHAVAYYTELCLKYGATQDEVTAALFGEEVRDAA